MKIVLLGKWPEGRLDGGVEVFSINLSESLDKMENVSLFFISFGQNSMISFHGKSKVITLERKKIYYLFPILAVIQLIREIKIIKPNLIHVIGSNISPYIFSILFFKNKTPIILSILGVMKKENLFEPKINKFISFINTVNEKFFIRIIPYIVVESNSIKEIFETHIESEIFVIPSGFNPKKIDDIALLENGMSDIFIASRLTFIKGIDILLKAIALVKEEIPNVKIFIAGIGKERTNLENLAKELKIADNVKFLGFVREDIKYSYYNSSKICVIPSRWDCQPITIFEALSFGKPVIASNTTNAEFLEEENCGLIFISENMEDLANKIKKLLLNNELREILGRNARKISSNYHWDIIADKYYNLYTKAILKYKETLEK